MSYANNQSPILKKLSSDRHNRIKCDSHNNNFILNTDLNSVIYTENEQLDYHSHAENVRMQEEFLRYIKTQRKIFEIEKINNIIRRLEYEYSDLSNKKIKLFKSNIEIEKTSIKEIIPHEMHNIAEYIGVTTNTDIISCVFSLCTAISTALRGRYCVKFDNHWLEMINIYTFIAKNSGEKKSALCELLKSIFNKFIMNKRTVSSQQINKHGHQQPFIRKIKTKRELDLANEYCKMARDCGETPDDFIMLLGKHSELGKMYEPFITKPYTQEEIFWDVSTPLGLARKMRDQGSVIALMEPEASILNSKYFKNGEFLSFFLKSYGGESFQYDTAVSSNNIYLHHPSLNILLLLQTRLLFEFYKKESFKEIGLHPRILPIFAEKFYAIHFFGVTHTKPNVDPDCMNIYEKKIQEILDFCYTQDPEREIFNIYCDANAYSLIKDFEAENSRDIESGLYRNMVPFIRKLHGHAARLAGVIHVWNYPRPHEHPITVDEMQAGIALAKIAREHAIIAYNSELRETKHYAIKILEYVQRQDWSRSRPLISAVDLQRNIYGLEKTKCHPALDFLEEHNFIRQHHEPGHARLCILHRDIFQVNLDSLADI